jgi:hypothetical protein
MLKLQTKRKKKVIFFFFFRNGAPTVGPPKPRIDASTPKHRSMGSTRGVYFVDLCFFYFSASIFLPVFSIHSITLTPFYTQFAHESRKGMHTHTFPIPKYIFSGCKKRALSIRAKIFIVCVFVSVCFTTGDRPQRPGVSRRCLTPHPQSRSYWEGFQGCIFFF